jgi:ADP-ribose pyrophosphatase YjhB (NUDIX family)
MTEPVEEMLNIYDAAGTVVGARRRSAAKAAGLPVGAVNVLVVNGRGEVLLQRRPAGKENGGRWDKSVGGHVSAGEDFDTTACRECGEELFDDGASPRVRGIDLAALEAFGDPAAAAAEGLAQGVRIAPIARHLNLRDVRMAPDGGIRNVIYHVGIYAGRSEVPISSFNPQASEVEDLAYFTPGVVDLMLLRGQLAPNMAFLWLAHGLKVLGLVARGKRQ